MPGQGKPLPEFMQLAGEWIVENQVFLHHAGTEAGPDFTRGAKNVRTAELCRRIGASQLAAAFALQPADIMEANRTGTLIFAGDR